MSRLRLYLDNALQTTEDLKYRNAKIGLKRSAEYNALFFSYVTNLELEGSAYEYLMSVKLAQGICSQVQIRIDYQCADFHTYDTLFEGIIPIREITVDEGNCRITCNAEDNTLSGKLISHIDSEIDVTAAKTFVGQTIVPVPLRTILCFDENLVSYQRQGRYIADILEYITKYITDDQAVFVSDHFQTNSTVRTNQTIVFDVPAQLATGVGSFTITYRNYFDQTITTTPIPIQGTAALTLDVALERLKGNAFAVTALSEYYINDHTKFAKITTNGTDTLTFENDFEFEILAVTGVAATVTDVVGETSTGAYKLSLFTGAALRSGAAVNPMFTFKKVYDQLNKIYNLGFSLKMISGVPTLRIEPIEYFIQQTQSPVSLLEIEEMEYQTADRFANDIFTTGDGSKDDQFRAVLNSKLTWITSSRCEKIKRDIKNEWIWDWQKISTQLTAAATFTENDEKLYVIECQDTPVFGNDAEVKIYEDYTYTDTVGTFITAYVQNAFINNYAKLTNWKFSATSDLILGDKTIVNDTLIKILRLYNFNTPLSYEDLKLLIANEFAYIPFGMGVVADKNGWIESFESSLVTSETDFVLLAQNM